MMSIAYALGAPAGGDAQGGIMAFLPLIIIFAIFYVLLILPQQRKMKKHREFLNNLEKGKNVITSGGVYGKITGLTDTVVTLEIAPEVKIKVARDHIAGYSA